MYSKNNNAYKKEKYFTQKKHWLNAGVFLLIFFLLIKGDNHTLFINDYQEVSNTKLNNRFFSTTTSKNLTKVLADSDGDGKDDSVDEDDDNDGIPDLVECPTPVSSGLTGPLSGYSTNINTSNASSSSVPHILDAITVNGVTYSDFVVPDGFSSNYNVANSSEMREVENGNQNVYSYGSNPNYDADILSAFQSRNLNNYQALDNNNYTTSSYTLTYSVPVVSTAGGFIAVTERLGNNPYVIQALNQNGSNVGTPITINLSDYVDLGVNVYTTSTQNANMGLYPLDNLAPVGTEIHGLRVSFGSTAINDGPDGKVFVFGDVSQILSCDYDNDGINNDLDLDSDNDGCPDAIEGGGSFNYSNLQNDRLTGGVDGNGVPTIASGGQGIGKSQDATDATACCTIGLDSDNDGIADFCDLDDDNDGILDIVEDPCGIGFFDDFGTGTTEVTTPFISNIYTFDANQLDDGEYTITTTGRPGAGNNTDWSTDPDHTPDDTDGRMLVINASYTAGEFYRRSFAGFVANSPITFSFWTKNIIIPSMPLNLKPNITYKIEDTNGNVLFTENTGDLQEVDGWQNFTGNFTTSETEVFFVLVNNATGGIGNDLAIDDIAFKQIGVCDHDNDGIINSLDLDSDNDSCPDAIEGGGIFASNNLQNDRLIGGVDANGIPSIAVGGQSVGSTQDGNVQSPLCDACTPGQPSFVDTDNDGIGDDCDLDADNDGILDSIEYSCITPQIQWSHNQLNGQSDAADFDPPSGSVYYSSSTNLFFGTGLDEATDNAAYSYRIRGADQPDFASAKSNQDFAQVSFTPSEFLILKRLRFGFFTTSGDIAINMNDYKIAVEMSTQSNFSNAQVLYSDVHVSSFVNGGYVFYSKPITEQPLLQGTEYYFRVYFYDRNNTDPFGRVRLDDIFFSTEVPSSCDIDGDGVPNELDLDSDNDGCLDAIEGTASFDGSNLQNDRLTGGVDGNGVPTVAGGGQGLGGSQDATDVTACCTIGLDSDNDGISDYCDLDDDNDGILDIVEDPCGIGFFDDFGTGTTEVTTPFISNDYIFDANQLDDGEYTITTTGRPGAGNNTDWSTDPDHTPDDTDGRMLVINASYTAGEFYRRSFAGFTANSPITFSFWTKNIIIPSMPLNLKPNITYKIEDTNGNVLFTANTGDLQEIDGWQNFIGTFTTSETEVFFVLVNNATGGIGNDLAIDDIAFKQIGVCDHDNDGIINSLDLDSDNDGCSDALEGSGNISSANIVNNRIGGTIDTDGVPVLVNGGQGLGASQDNTVSLGCNEVCGDGQDNDGDGFIDCADSDCQPVLSGVTVTQPTCANTTGGEIIIAASSSSALEYSIANEPNWQSSNTFSNLGVGQYIVRVRNASGCVIEYSSNPVILDFNTCTEICNNGIDDDGDGLVDCDDTDCGNIETATNINDN